jgi:hypothetical protein
LVLRVPLSKTIDEIITRMYAEFRLGRQPDDRLTCRGDGIDVFQYGQLTLERYLRDGHCHNLRWAFAGDTGGAACSLELLGKAALTKVNPALIADITADGNALLIATGIHDDASTFVSVQAKTAFKRCQSLAKEFDLGRALKIAANRNGYLHSGAPSAPQSQLRHGGSNTGLW